jgi:hypothetical protein
MSEMRVLRRIFGPKKEEVTESWRKLHNEELCNLYNSTVITRMISSWSMQWEVILVQYAWGRRKMHAKFWRRNRNKRGKLEDLGVGEGRVLKRYERN